LLPELSSPLPPWSFPPPSTPCLPTKVTLDHRGNFPLLRLSRGGVVLQGLRVDMVGFR